MPLNDRVRPPANINPGLSAARQATMLALLGSPRSSYDQTCRGVTNASLKALMATRSVGPFRATGLAVALGSLAEVFNEVAQEAPDVHAVLGTAGMQCARYVRGSRTSISNHAWGTAIDLLLKGQLDVRGDGLVFEGLMRIAPIFNRHGWYWGAAFGVEDGMHFECSDELIRRWASEGRLGGDRAIPAKVLSLGDQGPDVANVQRRLNLAGATLRIDGDFGPATRAAVIDFQARNGLEPDGAVGRLTERLLPLLQK